MPTNKQKAISASVAAALVVALPVGSAITSKWEGLSLTPYLDSVKIWTVCRGETQIKMRKYSRTECDEIFTRRFRDDYMIPAQQCVPTLAEKPVIWGASGSLAYNIGVPAFCRSSAARLFNTRQWAAGCASFKLWNKAQRRVIPGLTNRRVDEYKLCMSGVA